MDQEEGQVLDTSPPMEGILYKGDGIWQLLARHGRCHFYGGDCVRIKCINDWEGSKYYFIHSSNSL